MIKKRWLLIICICLIIIPVGTVLFANTERLGFKPAVNAHAVLLMELDTGRILVNDNGDIPLPPANMSNLMTELIILDDFKSGSISWDDEVTISQTAATVAGIQLSLREGEVLTVRELFQSLAVYSANDAAVALAEHASGSENAFVKRMNDKANEIGLSNKTRFSAASAVGTRSSEEDSMQVEETLMTAKDTAKLAAHLIVSHPDVLATSSQTQLKITGRDLYLSNTNWMLPSLRGPYSYEGTDGLKTGYNDKLGYCFTGTAERHGTRLIAVVMGTPTKEARFVETRKLFEYGFSKTLAWKDRFEDWMMHPVTAASMS